MSNRTARMAVVIALTLLVCVVGSVAGVWLASRVFGFSFDASRIAALSAVIGGAAIARDMRRARTGAVCPAP